LDLHHRWAAHRGDIYIHQADTILGVSMRAAVFGLFGALIAVLLVVLWQTWVIISLKRKARGS
jgi:flagellar biogenesis protein FliO